jgi:hypothetical protein
VRHRSERDVNITTPWPGLRVYARPHGEIDPYDPANAVLFRGEEAFAPDMQGWRRWSKPSPEPPLDAEFEKLLLTSIATHAPLMAALVARLAEKMVAQQDGPPVLVAILRAGVPIAALLSRALEQHCGVPVPVVALSLFHGLGWDEAALRLILRDFPGRPLWFVDGWTSGGGVAQELDDSFARWIAAGEADFTGGTGPQLAVLCDPRGKAQASAVRADLWVPSSCFTAPETLGFSRGFAQESGDLFNVYTFPRTLLRPTWVQSWLRIADVPPAPVIPADTPSVVPSPEGWRVHVNEVVRALINRAPHEVLLRDEESTARHQLAPLLHLCALRGVPVRFAQKAVGDWGALAAARMGT